MSDADLIYNALLRAERKMESACEEIGNAAAIVALATIRTIREEIGNGLTQEGR